MSTPRFGQLVKINETAPYFNGELARIADDVVPLKYGEYDEVTDANS
jgi:hypothetical protein